MRAVLLALSLLVCAPGKGDPIEVSAHLINGGEHHFIVRDTASHDKSGWLTRYYIVDVQQRMDRRNTSGRSGRKSSS